MKKLLLNSILIATLSVCIGWSNVANAQWVQANTGLTLNEVNSFATIGSTVFAATGNISGNSHGVFQSTDNGDNWVAVNTGFISLDVRQIIAVGTTLYAAVAGTNITDGGIYKSTDMGATWIQVCNGLNRNFAFSIAHLNGTLYCAISAPSSQKEVYTSTDGGANWTLTSDVVLNNNTTKSIVTIGGNILLASDDGQEGVFISTDNGATWAATSITNGTDAVAVLGSTVFAATGIGVFKSTDNGLNWTATTNVSGVIDNATALAVIGDCLIVGTPGGYVYSSSDNGTTWINVSTGGGNLAAEGFGMDATYIYAGINFTSVGIWKRPLSEFACNTVGVKTIQEGSPSIQIYPNPTDEILSINHNLTGKAELDIINSYGQQVLSQQLIGGQSTIDISHFAEGMYFLKIYNETKIYKSKIVVK